jgi:hypothetical protein
MEIFIWITFAIAVGAFVQTIINAIQIKKIKKVLKVRYDIDLDPWLV